MSSSYLDGKDWTNQFISKILQIRHLQWIFRNISLKDRKHGYLHTKKANEVIKEIKVLLDLTPEDVSKASQFLLEITFSELLKFHLETQKYWTLAMDAALKSKA